MSSGARALLRLSGTNFQRLISRRLYSSDFKPVYTGEVFATGGRVGHVRSRSNSLNHELTLPKGLGGPETPGTTNPEELFAAAYASCFLSALTVSAQKHGLKVPPAANVESEVTVGAIPDGSFKLAVLLKITIPGFRPADIKKIMDEAHLICPYSRATQGNIDVFLEPVIDWRNPR